MPKATTPTGVLIPINEAYIIIPGYGKVVMNNLPEVGDSKAAVYNSESIIGRSSPLHTYHYSDTRIISLTLHLYVVEQADIQRNIDIKRAIESCLYPRDGSGGAPFIPPPICQIKIGQFLATSPICCSLVNCSVRASSDVAWDETTLCPYKMDIDMTWWKVYNSPDLPSQTRIISTGR